MRRSLIDIMCCPYCGGSMEVSESVVESRDDVLYGLVTCRCFSFPIVDGILLLSLAKEYGGAEEALQPYAPLQAAAITFLSMGRLDDLRRWIRQHIPLAWPLMTGTTEHYLTHHALLATELQPHIDAYLAAQARFGVIGLRTGIGRRLINASRRTMRGLRPGSALELDQLREYYPSRFFSPYSHAVALQLSELPIAGRTLSLCCGHGMFENLLNADGRAREVVSVDAQFLSLLMARTFVRPEGDFICHDVQFGLPFRSGSFAAVFSSTCLPEIPTQRLFTTEAIRVTAANGWTWFDGIWASESRGADRVEPTRFYRFNQNLFASVEDYVPFFRECADGRPVAVRSAVAPAAFRKGKGRWQREDAAVRNVFATGSDPQIGVLVGDVSDVSSGASPAWLSPDVLAPSPVYEATVADGSIKLLRRQGFERPAANHAPATFEGYVESAVLSQSASSDPATLLDAFCRGWLTLLPRRFARDCRVLSRLFD